MTYYRSYFALLAIVFSINTLSAAQTAQQSLPTADEPLFNQLDEAIQPSQPSTVRESIVAQPQKQSESVASLDREFLLNNPRLLERLLNQSVQATNWEQISYLIPIYGSQEEYDQLLLWYAKGVLYRHNRQHGQAIQMFKNILIRNPNLLYVRFDLAVMLFEDKQYDSALDQFDKVLAGDLENRHETLAKQYIEAIQKRNTWSFDVSVQYEANNNVNNASYLTEYEGWRKNEDSLPKKAKGIRYHLHADRAFNLQGNHYLQLGLNQYGVHYTKESDYSEHTTRLGVAYQYQSIDSRLRVGPVFQRSFLGGNRYLDSVGIAASATKNFKNKSQSSLSYQHLKKRHNQVKHHDYNSHVNYFALTGAYFYSPTFILIGGVDYQREKTRTPENSFKRYGVRAGFIKEFNHGFSTRVDLSYRQKRHDVMAWYAPFFGAQSARKDHERKASITVWHRGISFYGMTPKLSYEYSKTNSNIPFFFNKRNKDLYLTIEKTF